MVVRSGGAEDPASRIERVLTAEEAGFRRAFVQAVQDILGAFEAARIERLLSENRIDEALDELEAAAGVLASQYGISYTAAGQATATWLSANALTVSVGFDQTNFRAVDQIRNSQLRLIREFTAEQRAATRTALQDGITEGINPRQQAANLRQSIGLTTRQYQAVQNYRRALESNSRQALDRQLRDRRSDRSVLRAIREGRPLSQAQIDAMVDRYHQRYIRYRANVIARTEALRAVHQGTEEMYQQAIDLGQILPGQLERKWNTAADERVRQSHVRLNGLVRGVGETFPGDEGELRYPGDPDAPASETVQCRCVISTRIMAN